MHAPLGGRRLAPPSAQSSQGPVAIGVGASGLELGPGIVGAVLLGDYLYAHGLVRIASFGETDAVADEDRFDRVVIFYTKFINTMKQEPMIVPLLS